MNSNEAIIACYSPDCKFNTQFDDEPTCMFKRVLIEEGRCTCHERRINDA